MMAVACGSMVKRDASCGWKRPTADRFPAASNTRGGRGFFLDKKTEYNRITVSANETDKLRENENGQ